MANDLPGFDIVEESRIIIKTNLFEGENKINTMSPQRMPDRLKLGYGVISKLSTIILLIPIAVLIWSCNQNQTGQREQKQSQFKGGNPMIIMSTSMGDIKIELYPDEAPETVKNFLDYVNDGFYDGTVFHRVIPGFMIQGGGFTPDMRQKTTKPPIKNEADNGLKNSTGTVAMARTNVVDSATSQFFINLTDNDFLNHGYRDFGYAVFGKVIEGMDVVNKIAGVKTGSRSTHQNVPVEVVMINSVRVVKPEGK